MILQEKCGALPRRASTNHTATQLCDPVLIARTLSRRPHQIPLSTTHFNRRERLVRLWAGCGGFGPMTTLNNLEHTLLIARDVTFNLTTQRLAAALVLAVGLAGSPSVQLSVNVAGPTATESLSPAGCTHDTSSSSARPPWTTAAWSRRR